MTADRETINLPDGYSLELVLAAPEISDPVAMAWDGNGVLYLVEMRPSDDADSPVEKSLVSRHEDTDGDGEFDKSTVFINEDFSPRQVLPLDDRILVTGADSLDLYVFRDSDGDGVADKKERVFRGGKVEERDRNLAGQLLWGIDNWVYTNRIGDRYRFRNGGVSGETIPGKVNVLGQSYDDEGRFFSVDREGSGPSSFQQAPIYGSFDLPGQLDGDFDSASGCGAPAIFRGNRLPEELQGNLFLPLPGKEMIRSLGVTREDGVTTLTNQFSDREFLTIEKMGFHPVGAVTGPDGRLYIIDRNQNDSEFLERGKRGNFLSRLVGLADSHKKKGRIYRLIHESLEGGNSPRMLEQSTADLVAHLSHPNGWWRDTAQRVLVLREDGQSVLQPLQKMLDEGDDPIGRLHALWTIDGLGRSSYELLAGALRDSDPRVQAAAIRVSELFIQGHDPVVGISVRAISKEAPADLARQIVASIRRTGTEDRHILQVERELFEKYSDNPVMAALGSPAGSDRKEEALEKQLISRNEGWEFEASHSGKTLRRAFDGNLQSRYATGGSQRPGMWIQVGFPQKLEITKMVLNSGSSLNDFPRAFEVLASADGKQWSDPVSVGKGTHPETVIPMPGLEAKFIRIVLTEAAPEKFWSVHEWEIYGKATE